MSGKEELVTNLSQNPEQATEQPGPVRPGTARYGAARLAAALISLTFTKDGWSERQDEETKRSVTEGNLTHTHTHTSELFHRCSKQD